MTHRQYSQSIELFSEATKYIPGGVNSPVRAFKAVGRDPIVIQQGSGCHVQDVDGNQYIDYVGSYGPLIAGHAHPAVVAAVAKAASRGTSFGMPTKAETHLAHKLVSAVDSIQLVRFVNPSGLFSASIDVHRCYLLVWLP